MPERMDAGKRGYLRENFRFVRLKDSRAQQIGYHYHEFDKIILLLGGKVTYVVEGVTYFLQPWDLLLVPHDRIHRPIIDPSEPYERVVLWLGQDWLRRRSAEEAPLDTCLQEAVRRNFHLLRIPPADRPAYLQLLQSLESAPWSEEFGNRQMADLLCQQLLLTVSRDMLRSQAKESHRESYRLDRNLLRADGRMLRRTVRIGLPTGLQSVLYAVSNMIITASVNSFGTDTVAAWVAMCKLDALTWLVMSAFSVAVMTFVGQNYGAQRIDRVKSSIRLCLAIAAGVTVLTGTLFILGGRFFFFLFTDDLRIIGIAVKMLLCLAPWYWLYVPVEVLSGSLRGMGDTLVPTMITAVGICFARVLWVFALVPRWHTIQAVTLSYPVTWGLTSLAFTVYYLRFRKKRLSGYEPGQR